MLKVEIIKVRPNHHLAASQVYSDFGGLASDARVRMLNDPIPARRYLWRLDTTRMVGVIELPKSRLRRLEIELQPMLGRVAVAPRGQEAFAGLWCLAHVELEDAARAAVDRGLARVNDAAADDWEDIRDGVDKALVELRETIAEVRSSSGPMGGRAAGPN